MKGIFTKITVAVLCMVLTLFAFANAALACEPDPHPVMYTVVFSFDGHGVFDPHGAPAIQQVPAGGAATAPTVIAFPHYAHVGWDKDFSNVTGHMLVTALYAPVYTVTFDPGEHGAFDPAGAAAVQEVVKGDDATAPTVIPDEGFKFVGWDVDFTNVTGCLTVTALYEPLYTVTFDEGEHGAFDPAGAVAVQQVLEGEDAIAPTVIPDEGFTFAGWDSVFTNITESITVTALYDPITYTVTFQPNNGGERWSVGVGYHAKITKPEDPKKCGSTFAGWFSDEALTLPWDFNSDVAKADMTLYAAWTPIVISGLPSTYTLYTGGRVTWNPAPDSGSWSYDEDYLSLSGGTFTALKAGETEVTYSVQCVEHTVKVTILQSELPQTGQPVDAAWLLSGISGLPLLAGLLVSRKKKDRS